MKKFIAATVSLALLSFTTFVLAQKRVSSNKNNNDADLQTVSTVDLSRFAGKWYEIAHYPNKSQKNCVGNTTTNYTAKVGGSFTVQNQCVLKNGTIGKASGEAKILDTDSNAKFELNFPSKQKSFFSSAWRNNYWIIDLDSNYQYAVAADPKRENLWILSRTPKMSDAVYQNILRRVEKQGFNPEKLTKTPQNVDVIKGAILQKQ